MHGDQSTQLLLFNFPRLRRTFLLFAKADTRQHLHRSKKIYRNSRVFCHLLFCWRKRLCFCTDVKFRNALLQVVMHVELFVRTITCRLNYSGQIYSLEYLNILRRIVTVPYSILMHPWYIVICAAKYLILLHLLQPLQANHISSTACQSLCVYFSEHVSRGTGR